MNIFLGKVVLKSSVWVALTSSVAAVSSDAKTSSSQYRLVPHARTLRKAREQIKSQVDDDAPHRQIKDYLSR